jgi:16S rRNA (guanine527-N7)-methyltransferase
VLALQALLEREGLGERATRALAQYGEIVLDANRRMNVTGARSAEEIAAHITDSLTILPYVREPYVDVGSGAGFPAIPVAIVAGIPVTLIEATAKKARLLESLLVRLDLRGSVVAERAETAARRPDLRETFATGSCRAVASASAVAELLLPLIAVGGDAILQRGSMQPGERGALEDAALMLGATIEMERELAAGRRIILARKQTPTPERFPRRIGVPQKRPLCE